MTFESLGSIATQHSVNDPPSSKIGVNVMPRFVVFHNPPNALATYHTFGFLGSICTSWIRPVASVGPMLRNSRPLRAAASRAVPFVPCPAPTIVVMTDNEVSRKRKQTRFIARILAHHRRDSGFVTRLRIPSPESRFPNPSG